MLRKRKASKESAGLLVKFAEFFFERWRAGLAIWLTILLGGGLIYTSLISREGFPPISFPLSVVNGTYLVNDVDVVDEEVAQPISNALKDLDDITDLEATAGENFFSIIAVFDESLTSQEGTELVRSTIESEVRLPEQADLNYVAIDPGSLLFEYDLLVQVYSTGGATATEIDAAAEGIAEAISQDETVAKADALNNVTNGINPANGTLGQLQTSFSRIGLENNSGEVEFYDATTVGVARVDGQDIIALSDAVQKVLSEIDMSQYGDTINAAIGADFARNIEAQISFLEDNMATGLIAVAVVSFLLITWRASIITALFMLSVMVLTIISLYVIGFTLNVITLFALILSLGLFVDDATIVVEALDVSKQNKKKKSRDVVREAITRVGRASFSGTLTTVLVFAILATPTGILGQFIRLIPITVIIALLLSFILSITLIPLLAKFIILNHRERSAITKMNPVLKLETWAGDKIEDIILSIRTMRGKLLGGTAVFISIALIFVGMYIFGFKVDNNTFPPAKDTNQIGIQVNFLPGATIDDALEISSRVDSIVLDSIGEYVIGASYGTDQQANLRQARITLDLIPYTERDVKSPVIVEDLETALVEAEPALPVASVVASQIDNGPPAEQFPFGIRVFSEDTEFLRAATADIAETMVGQVMENYNGEVVNILESRIEGVDGQIDRDAGERFAIVRFAYDIENATTVSLLTEERFNEVYTDEVLATKNFARDDIDFDAGQEGEFQDSFNTLILAVPLSLLLMYVLLVVQFRSFLQPMLILLAIPFTLFGVAAGLWLTDNSASFFALTGFIGLIGIAVNNTIMLTDYANQERRSGKGAIDAIATASRRRFRPLLATSLTTVVALLPLALSDPFWEGLAYTIIFGLLSSTFLVIISFPYYYLGLEWLTRGIKRAFRRA